MQRTYVPLALLAALALVGLLIYGVVGAGGSTTLVDAVRAGERPEAPDRTLPLLDGGEGSLAQWRGKPVLVNFWASWCDPCKAEAPLLERAHRRLEAKGGTVLGVTVSDATADSKTFVREHGLTFPSLRDVDDALGEDYGRTGVPESFLVDRDGRIVAISPGQVNEEFLDRALRLVGA
ncbi:MAG TPA: TlpA disulfide reductase family protein [Solirubrobacteraceae bacterium]|nr:TlpA disulfide reductase family protein [Solirubrobacteraceae bacterium]